MSKKEITFVLRTDSGDAVSDVTSLEKNFDSLNKKVADNNFTMREGAKLVREYQNIALQAGRESPIGREAIANAAALQDQLGDLRMEVTNLSKDGQNLKASLQLGSTVIAGYSAFQAVTALVGVENEELLKTLTKLQAANSLLLSIEQVRTTLEKESILVQKSKVIWAQTLNKIEMVLNGTKAQGAIATKLQATAQNQLTVATNAGAVSMRGLSAAIAATGIGALIIGIGLLIANFDKLTDIVGLTDNAGKLEFENFIKNSDEKIVKIKETYSQLERELALRLQKAKLEGASDQELLRLSGEISTEKQKALQAEQAEILKQIKAKEEQLKAEQQIKYATAAYNVVSEESKQKQIEIKKSLEELGNSYKNLGLSIEELNVATATASKKGFDDALKLEKDLYKKRDDAYKANIQKQLKDIQTAEQLKIQLTQEGTQERLDAELNAITAVEMFMVNHAKTLELNENEITLMKLDNVNKRIAADKKYADSVAAEQMTIVDLQRKTQDLILSSIEDSTIRKSALLKMAHIREMEDFTGSEQEKLELEINQMRERQQLTDELINNSQAQRLMNFQINTERELQAQKDSYDKERELLVTKYGEESAQVAAFDEARLQYEIQFEIRKRNELAALQLGFKTEDAENKKNEQEENNEKLQEEFEMAFEQDGVRIQEKAKQALAINEKALKDKEISEEQHADNVKQIEEKAAEESKQLNIAKVQFAQQMAAGLAGVAGQLSSLAKEGSDEQKALIGIQIALDTASGIAAAVSSGMQMGWPMALIAIPAGIAAVLSGIASAKKAFGKAGGSSSAGSGGASVSIRPPSMPSTTSTAQSGGPEDRTLTGSNLNDITVPTTSPGGAQQVVVLASDITDAMTSQNTITQVSTVE